MLVEEDKSVTVIGRDLEEGGEGMYVPRARNRSSERIAMPLRTRTETVRVDALAYCS